MGNLIKPTVNLRGQTSAALFDNLPKHPKKQIVFTPRKNLLP